MLYRRTSAWKNLIFNSIAILLMLLGVGSSVAVADPILEEPLRLGDNAPSFPLTSVLALLLQDINEQMGVKQSPDGQSETPQPPYTITEDGKEVKIKMCTANPDDPDKQICVTIIIDKATSNTRIGVEGYIILPITLLIKCNANAQCVFKDAFWTEFCTIQEQQDGKVVWDCNIDYLGIIKFKGKILLYVQDGKLCFQTQKPDGQLTEPECAPINDIPEDIRDLWKRLKLPYLPDYQEPPPPPVVAPPCLDPSEVGPPFIPVPGEDGAKPGLDEDTGDDFFPGTCNPYYYSYPVEL